MSEDKSGDLKCIVQTLDMTAHGYNGFAAPGARLKEQPDIERICEMIGAKKCPRCWNYHTVQGNPQDTCDRCVTIVNGMLDELVARELWTAEDVTEWKEAVRASVNRWKVKT